VPGAAVIRTLTAGRTADVCYADHGNAELMIDPGNGRTPYVAHDKPGCTVDPGERRFLPEGSSYQLREGGSLRDISPTLLGMFGVRRGPGRMSGGRLRLPLSTP